MGDGPFQVLSKISGNLYKIELSGEYGVSASLNVFYFSFSDVGNDEFNSRSNSLREIVDGEDVEHQDLNKLI